MSKQIYPCLWFDGKAKEAAEFYCSVFTQGAGSSENAKVITDTPMVVIFEIYGKKIMGLNGGPLFKINPSISLFVLCSTIDETNAVWNKLLEGGSVLMPIDKYFWSERYGWVQDKYGMTWQVSVVNKTGDQPKITPSMLFTAGQFGKAGEAIKFYTSIFDNSSTTVLFPYPDGDVNAGKVMYSEFKLNGYDLIAMDGPGDHAYTFNEGVSLVVECESQKKIDHYWNKLTENGGQESICGWLKDKFGVSWQIIPENMGQLINDPKKEGRAIQEMMKMKKIVVEKLVNA